MTAVEAFESVFAFQNERYVKNRRFTVTASMFVPRSAFDAVGPFENGVPEDIDWCRRARAKGYRIGFAPRSIVGHPARRTMDELKRKWRRLALEWFTAARRDGKGPAAMLLHEWAAMLTIAPDALALMTTRRLSGARSRILAIGALARIRAYRFMVAHRAILGRSEKVMTPPSRRLDDDRLFGALCSDVRARNCAGWTLSFRHVMTIGDNHHHEVK